MVLGLLEEFWAFTITDFLRKLCSPLLEGFDESNTTTRKYNSWKRYSILPPKAGTVLYGARPEEVSS